MKTIEERELKLCVFQASLFEESNNQLNCGSAYFIKVFMNSDLAYRMDKTAFLIESKDVRACLEELKSNHKLNRGNYKYPSFIMSWIGYIYRYFSLFTGLSSKKVYKIIKPKELYGLYEAYHSLDSKEAVTRIMESKNISLKKDLVSIAKKYYL